MYPGNMSETSSTKFPQPLPFSVPYTQKCHSYMHIGGRIVANGYATFSTEGLYWAHGSYSGGGQVECNIFGTVKINI